MNGPNRLIKSTSPYLLQHAYNPVDWYEWGPEALERARTEDKPIIVSIGYSACHWCHVMERESFESDDVAELMNESFICIKVDREERPDVDQVYMEAAQAMSGRGGWPLNVFLTSSRKPFYGGTYYPKAQWQRLLREIAQAYKSRRPEIDASASSITEHISISDLSRFATGESDAHLQKETISKMALVLSSRYDKVWGGMDKAPKFVMPSIWMFLLRAHTLSNDANSLNMVTHTLQRMSEAGLYDQLGGGFARYSVDAEWFAPHFEKMLYDNAQLLTLYSEAYSVHADPRFQTIVFETIQWLEREMLNANGGFYSALDADSEGEEGKFYTWTAKEIQSVLGERAGAFIQHFGIRDEGNWEGVNILNTSGRKSQADWSVEKQLLLQAREKRVRPGLDDKIIASWNAMTIHGLTDAYRIFGESRFLMLAERAMAFLEREMMDDSIIYRAYKNGRGTTAGFLEDYAFVIQAYTSLYECTFKEEYLQRASLWLEITLTNFMDPEEKYFHFTSSRSERLIARKKEIFDNVIPSSNSVMAKNLIRLGRIMDREDWVEQAKYMVIRLNSIISSEPAYMSNWGIALAELATGGTEIVISGVQAESYRASLSKTFLPFAIFVGSHTPSTIPLLRDRSPQGSRTQVYVCTGKTCKLPVDTVEEARRQLTTA